MNSEPQRTPIIYYKEQDIRFGEIDLYGHVSAKHYIDIVSSARLLFLEQDLNCSIEKMTEQGIGFYLRKAVQNFKLPIIGMQRVGVKSYASKAEGSLIIVEFSILNADQSKTFATGQLEYVVVDLKTQRPMSPPAWVFELFFRDA